MLNTALYTREQYKVVYLLKESKLIYIFNLDKFCGPVLYYIVTPGVAMFIPKSLALV